MPARSISELAAALAEAAGAEVELERPGEPEHGDYATNVALRLAPTRQRAPRDLAEELAAVARDLPDVDRAEVAGPGFLNLFLDDGWFGQALGECTSEYVVAARSRRERKNESDRLGGIRLCGMGLRCGNLKTRHE